MHDFEITRDVEFAQVDGRPLLLDLYRPVAEDDVPAVVMLHGGAWMLGDRTMYAAERIEPVVRHGIAVASASYRFTDEATYPAQLHDVKAAVRWVRANAEEHGLSAERVGAWGASAGGYLALMLGLTGGRDELEGDVGGHTGLDSSVQAVCALFAPSDLVALDDHVPDPDMPFPAHIQRGPAFDGPSPSARLLGLSAIRDDTEAALAASPVMHAGRGDARFLLLHGDADPMVPVSQSQAMFGALAGAGQDASLLILAGANHEGPEFARPPVLAAVAEFFADAL
ncbi:alpha/beta hydrolase [Capillimicrobium parvum]|nr:alpha/beta hydrolase [Capillimicrobium parvum]